MHNQNRIFYVLKYTVLDPEYFYRHGMGLALAVKIPAMMAYLGRYFEVVNLSIGGFGYGTIPEGTFRKSVLF